MWLITAHLVIKTSNLAIAVEFQSELSCAVKAVSKLVMCKVTYMHDDNCGVRHGAPWVLLIARCAFSIYYSLHTSLPT